MITLFIIMVTVFVAYVTFIWAKYGVQPSISHSYFILPTDINVLFTLFCWGFAIPAIIVGGTGLMFLAGAGIGFVGAAALTTDKMTETVHTIGATVGITAGQLAIMFNFGLPFITVGFVAIMLTILIAKIKNTIWWIEIAAFISICLALGINLL